MEEKPPLVDISGGQVHGIVGMPRDAMTQVVPGRHVIETLGQCLAAAGPCRVPVKYRSSARPVP